MAEESEQNENFATAFMPCCVEKLLGTDRCLVRNLSRMKKPENE